MREAEIVHTALGHLEQLLPFKVKWIAGKGVVEGRIMLKLDGKMHCMDAEVKTEVKTNMLPRLLDQGGQRTHFMVIAETIQPKAKEILRANHIAYLEGNGNIFLYEDTTFLLIDTQKPTALRKEKLPTGFTEAETRLLYQLLLDETLLCLTYREISEKTATALGGITPLFNKLTHQGFLLKSRDTVELRNKKELLDRWVAAYEKKLYPKLPIGRFRFAQKERFEDWKELELKEGKTWWAAEPAANLLTNYLKPGVLSIYTREDRLTLMKKYHLAPDPKGNVVLLQPFWPEGADTKELTVPPLLVYADLLATGEHRCIETAQVLYERSLAAQF